eukprot:6467809-Amphidinium_carterae.1
MLLARAKSNVRAIALWQEKLPVCIRSGLSEVAVCSHLALFSTIKAIKKRAVAHSSEEQCKAKRRTMRHFMLYLASRKAT